MRALLGQVRPHRQSLLFSATFPPTLERLARDTLSEPVRVAIGAAGDANEDVTQIVEILPSDEHKWAWLSARLGHFVAQYERATSPPRARAPRLAGGVHATRTPAPRRTPRRTVPPSFATLSPRGAAVCPRAGGLS